MKHMWEKDGYLIRLAEEKDKEAYYDENFNPLDKTVARFTGCKEEFTREEVISFYEKCLTDDERYDFLIFSPEGKIVGESVINEIDWNVRSANYRICIFKPTERGKGIGGWAVETAVRFAFEELNLHRLELDVYSFNKRAMHLYEKSGFKVEGIHRDAILDGEEYADDILMSILENEWNMIK
ncbi:hypothetical protein JCM37172_19830 [Faecalimonas hominis]